MQTLYFFNWNWDTFLQRSSLAGSRQFQLSLHFLLFRPWAKRELPHFIIPIVSHKTVFIISVYDSVWIFKCESASNNPDTSFHRVWIYFANSCEFLLRPLEGRIPLQQLRGPGEPRCYHHNHNPLPTVWPHQPDTDNHPFVDTSSTGAVTRHASHGVMKLWRLRGRGRAGAGGVTLLVVVAPMAHEWGQLCCWAGHWVRAGQRWAGGGG